MAMLPLLTPGSVIRIISPAGKCREEQIIPAVEWLAANGYHPVTGRHVFGEYFQFSGTEEERIEDLQEALDDPLASAIICTRGGNGTIGILDRLDFSRFMEYPKWLVGYSDITLLHNRIHQLGFPSIHGVMCRHFLDEAGMPSESLHSLMSVLTGERPVYRIPVSPYNRKGTAWAPLVGGNLSMLYSMTGTPYDIDTAGKILFIEELSEYLYHIDRMMTSLRLAGKLRSLSGLVVGQFTDVKDNPDPYGKSVEQIILNAVADSDFPVCFGMPSGHDQPNMALMMGARWKLITTEENSSFHLT